MIDISVIIPCYNSKPDMLKRTLKGLGIQTLPSDRWELVIIDNNSFPKMNADLSWHPHGRIIVEPKQGLTYARLAGFSATKGAIIVIVDDDNVLAPDYLANALYVFEQHPKLGAAGGKSLPDFQTPPPQWLKEFSGNLALRDLGARVSISNWQNKYPADAPIGAGMVLRREALGSYRHKQHIISDRNAGNLSSGGDNDMVIEVLKSGWQTGYFPELVVTHIIPAERMSEQYIARLVNQTNKSWVQLLSSHQICPWPKISRFSLPFRKIKAWFACRAWRKPEWFIRWRGACGLFDGLASSTNNV